MEESRLIQIEHENELLKANLADACEDIASLREAVAKLRWEKMQAMRQVESLRLELFETNIRTAAAVKKCQEDALEVVIDVIAAKQAETIKQCEETLQRSLKAIAEERDIALSQRSCLQQTLHGLNAEIQSRFPLSVEEAVKHKIALLSLRSELKDYGEEREERMKALLSGHSALNIFIKIQQALESDAIRSLLTFDVPATLSLSPSPTSTPDHPLTPTPTPTHTYTPPSKSTPRAAADTHTYTQVQWLEHQLDIRMGLVAPVPHKSQISPA